MTVVQCPHCATRMNAPAKLFGKSVRCLNCRAKLRVPRPTRAAAASPVVDILPNADCEDYTVAPSVARAQLARMAHDDAPLVLFLPQRSQVYGVTWACMTALTVALLLGGIYSLIHWMHAGLTE